MPDRTITVIADDKIVIVNGEAYRCLGETPPLLHAMRWVPNADPAFDGFRGYIEAKPGGDSHGFKDFATIAPFVAAWEAAKAAEAERLATALADAANAAQALERVNARAREEQQRKFRESQMDAAARNKIAAAALAERAVEEAQKRAQEMVAQRASEEQRRALNVALAELGNTDHEVIKAMETKLAAEGQLPGALVARRRAAREMVKAEKAKLSQS